MSDDTLRILVEETEHPSDRLKDIVAEMLYTYPKIFFSLKEEDCAEFVIMMYPEIPKIIKNYDKNITSFEGYIYSVVRTKVNAFKFKKQKENFLRNLLESTQKNDIYNGMFVKEKPVVKISDPLNILLNVFAIYPALRRKFFVFFLSLTPFMELYEIESWCKAFCYDIKQTISLTFKVSQGCSRDLDNLIRLKAKRTFYYAKYLEDSTYNFKDLADEDKKAMIKKNNEISKIQKKADHSTLGKYLGLNQGTVGNYLYFSRNLLSWVKDIYSSLYSYKELGMTKSVFDSVRAQGSYDKIPNMGIFYPYKEFKIKDNCKPKSK